MPGIGQVWSTASAGSPRAAQKQRKNVRAKGSPTGGRAAPPLVCLPLSGGLPVIMCTTRTPRLREQQSKDVGWTASDNVHNTKGFGSYAVSQAAGTAVEIVTVAEGRPSADAVTRIVPGVLEDWTTARTSPLNALRLVALSDWWSLGSPEPNPITIIELMMND